MRKSSGQIRSVAKWIFYVSILIAGAFFAIVFFVYKGINFEGDERLFEGSQGFGSTTFLAENSGEWIEVETSGSIRKSYYSLNEISPYITKGFIAVEDKIFYKHKGIDLKRTVMAAVNYITKKEKVFGASTITQQVVKNISGDNQLSLKRKLEEIIRAIHIERNYSKDEILEVYLNVIPMSDNIYGVGAASRAYFGCEPSELSAEEAATLIGITNAPTAYSPYLNPQNCKKKRDVVLSVMHSDGVISDEEYTRAKKEPLSVIPRENREDLFDSWFVERVIEEACDDIAKKYEISSSAARMLLLGGGYRVYTTMNIKVQKTLERYFENADNFPTEILSGLNYAMAITDSESGRLVGMVGRVGKKTGNRLLNHALIPHVPGSTLKPIALYAPLIDEGKINWATVFDDVPVSFIEEDGKYREYPRNSPAIYDGLTTVKSGLCYSKNTLAVRLCDLRGTKAVFNTLRNEYGFDTLIEKEGTLTDIATAPMALGQLGRGVSLLKLTEGFSVFTGYGILREATTYSKITDHKNNVLIEKTPFEKKILKPSTAKIMNQMLRTVVNEGTASEITLKGKISTAGKTGTSGGSKDKMFVGYTPYFTAGIWCGYDAGDRAVTGLSKSHLKIWDEIMLSIHEDMLESENSKEFSTEGLYYLPYCKDSGMIYSDNCIYDPRGERREYGYFAEDNMPAGKCERHIPCYYDTETKGIATTTCPDENLAIVSLISIPDRVFPKEIIVTDAEFVYRDIDRYTERPIDYSLPYFYYTIPDGVYVGRSKGKKQFNSNCYIHND